MSKTIDDLLSTASAGLLDAKFALGFAKRSGVPEAITHATGASKALGELCGGLVALGAQDQAARNESAVNPLAQLAQVERSRSEALRLLDALRHAHELAEQLHQVNPGSRWVEEIEETIAGLELEIFGPSAAVHGGRE